MIKVLDAIVGVVVVWAIIIWWIAGAVIAEVGFLKAAAVCCPPYAWYLVVQKIMQFYHIVS